MADPLTKVLTQLAERSQHQKEYIGQNQYQRRNAVVDLYGVEYSSFGDANNPATFYLSISKDMLYLERFEFKLIVDKFAIPIGGGISGDSVEISPTNLDLINQSIVPNPHIHTIKSGVSLFDSTAKQFSLTINGVDMTDYLIAIYGEFVNGMGVFPSEEENYDLLEVAGICKPWENGVITSPGIKKIEVFGDGIFSMKLLNYLKFSHVNR
ncbi:hypothetical protein FACS189418_6980 [Clostridia bacterium]|nr:hypothetical protein FACS189418_6980 [Clostridia bacterium]